MNKEQLIDQIEDTIKTNGTQSISGSALQTILKNMVNLIDPNTNMPFTHSGLVPGDVGKVAVFLDKDTVGLPVFTEPVELPAIYEIGLSESFIDDYLNNLPILPNSRLFTFITQPGTGEPFSINFIENDFSSTQTFTCEFVASSPGAGQVLLGADIEETVDNFLVVLEDWIQDRIAAIPTAFQAFNSETNIIYQIERSTSNEVTIIFNAWANPPMESIWGVFSLPSGITVSGEWLNLSERQRYAMISYLLPYQLQYAVGDSDWDFFVQDDRQSDLLTTVFQNTTHSVTSGGVFYVQTERRLPATISELLQGLAETLMYPLKNIDEDTFETIFDSVEVVGNKLVLTMKAEYPQLRFPPAFRDTDVAFTAYAYYSTVLIAAGFTIAQTQEPGFIPQLPTKPIAGVITAIDGDIAYISSAPIQKVQITNSILPLDMGFPTPAFNPNRVLVLDPENPGRMMAYDATSEDSDPYLIITRTAVGYGNALVNESEPGDIIPVAFSREAFVPALPLLLGGGE